MGLEQLINLDKKVNLMSEDKNLSSALKEFQDQIQRNYDAIEELIKKREQIRTAPANQADVFSRMENSITVMSARYLKTHAGDIGELTSYKKCQHIDLFEKNIKVDGLSVKVFDPDSLIFFNQESLLIAAEAISKEITLPNAGLQFEERAEKIASLNDELSQLEIEKQALHAQASDAGLILTEEYVPI